MSLWQRLFGKKPSVGELPSPAQAQAEQKPLIELVSYSIDPERGIRVELDWQPEFVHYLKSIGYSGQTEDDIVMAWFKDYAACLEQRYTSESNNYG